MKAIVVQQMDEHKSLVWQTTTTPTYGDEAVLVDIHATALNRADLMQRAGFYPPPAGAPDTLGLEMAGRIAAVGSRVVGWQVGDRVCALLAGGGYAEQVAVPHKMLMQIPDSWDYPQATAIPEVFYTAYVNLFMEAGLQNGETVLIHGGASGVGTAAIQLARQAGAHVLITAGTDEKTARCRELGASLGINYKKEDFAEAVEDYTNSEGVDVILDCVGADYFERNVQLLKLRGRLVFIGLLSGGDVEFNLAALMGRRLRLIGSVLRSRALAEKIEIKENFMRDFWESLTLGQVKPIIDSIYPIEEANEAHQHMVENRNIGKIILQVR